MKRWTRYMYTPNLPLGKGGERVTASPEHRSLSKNAAKEGMVLLKNEGQVLPLASGARVALFGKGTVDYVKGGGGSGDVTVSYTRNLYQGIKELDLHVEVFEPLVDFYKKEVENQYQGGAEPGMTLEPELSEDLISGAKAFTDTAIVSICRFSGEGWDRKSSYDKDVVPNEHEWSLTAKAAKIFEDGDFYLSHAEQKMVEAVTDNFDKVIVVMNVGGMVDTQWFKGNSHIQSVLMAWQGGMEGGLAAAELLFGLGTPSGKLVDTYAKRLEDYPSTYNFHESESYVEYTEDIYVGYRYFETIPGASDKVNYPFGYGLSYTTFDWSVLDLIDQNDQFTLEVDVLNTGKYAGREVVQVYVTAPQGMLGKASKTLVAFKKTKLLEPGESQLLSLSFSASDFASYDDRGLVAKSAYVLEKGGYEFFVGTSVRDGEILEYDWILDEDRIVESLSEKLKPSHLSKRLKADGSYEELEVGAGNNPDDNDLNPLTVEETDGFAPLIRQADRYTLWPRKNTPKFIQLIDVAEGTASMDDFLDQMSDDELGHFLGGQANTGVANTFGFGNLPKYGVPNIMTADGPAGLRIRKECGVNTTAWPCSTLLACTWDEDLVYSVGQAGAKEVRENNIGVWLTPAINIHRSPLCGRNFEYYSEDPFVAGKLAAAMVKGIQSQRVAATVKHFALNNKETNRKNSDSRVSERAAREIYLKAFEMVVKEADPWCIMTAYNIINGHRASENKDLITGVLRQEWGFKGMVMTDWWTYGEHYKEVKAGNDVKMACGFPERLIEAMEKGVLSREEMKVCAKKVFELFLKL